AASGTRLLALVTLAARLAMTGALAAAKPLHAMCRTGTRFEVVQPDHDCFVSSPLFVFVRMPRVFKISSRRRRERSASIVALTTLAWLLEPNDFASTSRIP